MISITNLAWNKQDENKIFLFLKKNNINLIEVSLTKEFNNWEYININNLNDFKNKIFEYYNLKISSLQSIFFNIPFNIFQEKEKFLDHFKKVIYYSNILDCKYIVFGSPKNRKILDKDIKFYDDIFIDTFEKVSSIDKNIFIGIESNPTYYNCNYLTSFKEVKDIVDKINKPNILPHLDFGCLTLSNEDFIEEFISNKNKLNLIHVSIKDLKSIHEDDKIKYFFANFYDSKKIFSIEIVNETILNIQKSINILKV